MDLLLIKLLSYSMTFYIREKFKNDIHSLNVMGCNTLCQGNPFYGIIS